MQPFTAIVDNTKKGMKRIYPSFQSEDPICTEKVPLNTEFIEEHRICMPELSTIPKSWKLFHMNKPDSNILPESNISDLCREEVGQGDYATELETGKEIETQQQTITSMAVPVECSQISCTACQVYPRSG